MKTVACVLAAGNSTRFGRPKQFCEFEGEPLLRRAVRTAMSAGSDSVMVIWGAVGVEQLLRGLDVERIENRCWPEGIASSIRCAVESAPRSRILFTVADQPRVTADHLRALLSSEAAIAASGYRGIAGVPAAFDPQFAAELLALRGDQGAKSVIDTHRREVAVIPFEAAAFDIDREEDIAAGGERP